MPEIKTLKVKIVKLKKSIKAAELRLETAETEEEQKKHETTLKTFRTKLANAKTELDNAKSLRNEELKSKFKSGVKSIGTKTGIAITGTILIIGAAIGYEYFKKDEDEVSSDATASDNV